MRVIDTIAELTELIGGPRKWHGSTRIDHGIAGQEMPASQLN
jgi:phosphoglycolate phosphatase